QQGLQGISFGPFLIKQVVTSLQRGFPNLRIFSTLSPIPGFRSWLVTQLAQTERIADVELIAELVAQGAGEMGTQAELAAMVDHPQWPASQSAVAMKEPLLRLAATYLHQRRDKDSAPLDPVARFHLGNGARIEQLNWQGDISPKGLREACGLMVNYQYRLKEIEKNIEAYAAERTIAVSSRVKSLLRGHEEQRGLSRLGRFLPRKGGSGESSDSQS
ncbi:MAG: Malonyl-CoA decarboxylase, partial [Desulfuromonas sp.]